MDTTGSCPIYLYSSSTQPQAFTATLTPDTPLQFSITPTRGTLQPRPDKAPEALYGSTSGSIDMSEAPLWVSYTCRDFGKVVKGRVIIKTQTTQFCFDLRGQMPIYVPPSPAQFQSSVDHRLSPEMAKRLQRAQDTKSRPNMVAQNLKAIKEAGGTFKR